MMRVRGLVRTAVPVVVGVAACAGAPLGSDGGFREAFPWIQAGRTNRDEFVAHLGAPRAEFESGRLAAWRISHGLLGPGPEPVPIEENPFRRQDRWGDTTYWSLVVRFDGAGRAERVGMVAHP